MEADDCVFRLFLPKYFWGPIPPCPPYQRHRYCPPRLVSWECFLSIIMTNGNPECFRVALNFTSMLFRLRSDLKKIWDLLRLKRSGSREAEYLGSGVLGMACERSLRGFSHQNVRLEHGKARTFYLGAHSLPIITEPLLQPSARFSSPWYECSLLEDAIVWMVEQKKGKKWEGISHQSSSQQSLRSLHPLLYYLFLRVCSLSLSAFPIRSFIPSSVKAGRVGWLSFLLRAI